MKRKNETQKLKLRKQTNKQNSMKMPGTRKCRRFPMPTKTLPVSFWNVVSRREERS